jgi:8-oxo-dGTP pyrophosphatase MutT (NUDIX family)
MHRFKLLTLLAQYLPTNPEELKFKARIQQFMSDHPNCFERTLAIGHITASCWLLSADASRALLTHHAKLNAWFQLGGHCDGNPDVLAVALREAQEESGINAIEPVSRGIFDLDIHTIPANSREQAHDHYDIRFLLKVTSQEQPQASDESKALRWISKDRADLPAHTPSILRMFDKWIYLNATASCDAISQCYTR